MLLFMERSQMPLNVSYRSGCPGVHECLKLSSRPCFSQINFLNHIQYCWTSFWCLTFEGRLTFKGRWSFSHKKLMLALVSCCRSHIVLNFESFWIEVRGLGCHIQEKKCSDPCPNPHTAAAIHKVLPTPPLWYGGQIEKFIRRSFSVPR